MLLLGHHGIHGPTRSKLTLLSRVLSHHLGTVRSHSRMLAARSHPSVVRNHALGVWHPHAWVAWTSVLAAVHSRMHLTLTGHPGIHHHARTVHPVGTQGNSSWGKTLVHPWHAAWWHSSRVHPRTHVRAHGTHIGISTWRKLALLLLPLLRRNWGSRSSTHRRRVRSLAAWHGTRGLGRGNWTARWDDRVLARLRRSSAGTRHHHLF